MSQHQRDEVRAAYDVIADTYLERVANTRNATELRLQISGYIGELSSRVQGGGKVADLGCGAGIPFTAMLADLFEVTGVDFSSRQLDLARENVPRATFLQADMTEVSFPAGSLDAVTAFFSIIHVHRDLHAELFRDIASWLKPGGVFIAALGKRGQEEDWDEDWLGARMFWSYHKPDVALTQIREAGMDVERARLETVETGVDGPETFFWVIASKG